jgi:prepilin-type N-terminal cleavage/methylation domain-containing protein
MVFLRKSQSGFTLVEMAVVLVIVGLMLGGLLLPLSAQMDQSRVTETRKGLSEIKEALIGYAIVNGRLPCPDNDNDGVENAPCNTVAATGGNLPWVTLGVQGRDPWGRLYQYRVSKFFSVPFSLATGGDLNVYTDKTLAATEGANVPAVIFSSGKNGATQPPSGTDELENTTDTTSAKFDKNFVNHDFASPAAANGEFDDILVWISPNILMNRMVAAGKLP